MLDADAMEELLWDSLLVENILIDPDDTNELCKGEDVDGDNVSPEV